MKLFHQNSGTTLYHGDCLSVMPALGVQVDSIITDPPYGLGFMGKQWDTPGSMFERKAETKNTFDHVGGNHNPSNSKDRQRTQLSEGRKFQQWCTGWAEACLDVTKPGGMLLAFGGTRTFHRLACAIEDAGWEIRDCIMWVYGSGFPKSLDISKAIDKAAGAERERIRGVRSGVVGSTFAQDAWSKEFKDSVLSTEAITDAAQFWNGYGTALKPAWEPIIVAMKPLEGTFAENAQRHGVAGLAIDDCRVDAGSRPCRERRQDEELDDSRNTYGRGLNGSEAVADTTLGRFPANLIHDGSDEVLAVFPVSKDGVSVNRNRNSDEYVGNKVFGDRKKPTIDVTYGGSGSAARFFYCAKASRAERGKTNTHPTVKPLALMRYLCRLTKTPTGGIVLDPFAGSGSTLIAASLEGREAIGIEQDEGHCRIVVDRLGVRPPKEPSGRELKRPAIPPSQRTLFA